MNPAQQKKRSVEVNLGERSYPVIIGSGVRQRFTELFKQHGKGQAFWITDRNVVDAWGEDLGGLCSKDSTDLIILPPGEDQKRLITIERISQVLLQMGAERGDTLIACGGGVVGDIGGFAAACYQRGMAYVQIPTTLLAMVDASVGGKTGVDLPEGKNLIGAFHQPRYVLIDVDFLGTLNERELRSGYVEVLKTALIGDRKLYQMLAGGGQEQLFGQDQATLIEVIEACVRFKAGIVEQDEREAGLRRILNFGHTIGHALEAIGRYSLLKHGEAVLWGILAALDLSVDCGALDKAEAAEIYTTLDPLTRTVPTMYFDVGKVAEMIYLDKKVRRGQPHFVLLKAIGKALVTDEVGQDQLQKALGKLIDRMGSKLKGPGEN